MQCHDFALGNDQLWRGMDVLPLCSVEERMVLQDARQSWKENELKLAKGEGRGR